MELTGAQIRAARGLTNWSVKQLADRTSLAINTIRRAEADNGPVTITAANTALIRNTFEAAGVVFIDADALGPGVRLRDREPAPRQARRQN